MRISDWSSDVCSSDLKLHGPPVEQSLGLHRAATVATAFLAHDGDVAAAHLPAASSWIGCCGASQRSGKDLLKSLAGDARVKINQLAARDLAGRRSTQ